MGVYDNYIHFYQGNYRKISIVITQTSRSRKITSAFPASWKKIRNFGKRFDLRLSSHIVRNIHKRSRKCDALLHSDSVYEPQLRCVALRCSLMERLMLRTQRADIVACECRVSQNSHTFSERWKPNQKNERRRFRQCRSVNSRAADDGKLESFANRLRSRANKFTRVSFFG